MKRTRLNHIRRMEGHYDAVRRALDGKGDMQARLRAVQPDLEALREYMDSGQWQADYEADEAGEIPATVRRGVLSQDGLYNLLQEVHEILL